VLQRASSVVHVLCAVPQPAAGCKEMTSSILTSGAASYIGSRGRPAVLHHTLVDSWLVNLAFANKHSQLQHVCNSGSNA
jgi:hypothetical protein